MSADVVGVGDGCVGVARGSGVFGVDVGDAVVVAFVVGGDEVGVDDAGGGDMGGDGSASPDRVVCDGDSGGGVCVVGGGGVVDCVMMYMSAFLRRWCGR